MCVVSHAMSIARRSTELTQKKISVSRGGNVIQYVARYSIKEMQTKNVLAATLILALPSHVNAQC